MKILKLHAILLSVAAAVLSVSCTSASRGTTQQLVVTSSVAKTKVQLSTGEVSYTPATFTVKRKAEITVTASKPGYKTQVKKSLGAVQKGAVGEAVVGSVLLWGPFNAADYFNGSLKKHAPMHFEMVR
ncbi:MAG: translation initiation factor 2 [Akkermansiaceae bacterium]